MNCRHLPYGDTADASAEVHVAKTASGGQNLILECDKYASKREG